MTTSPSETIYEQLVGRLGEWAKARNLTESDVDLIIDLIAALRAADDTLCAAGFFASAVANPQNLSFAWASGKRPFDPQAALKQLKKSADYLVWAVDTELFGPNAGIHNPPAPPDKYYYLLTSNGAKLQFESPVPMGVGEICRMARQAFIQARFRSGDTFHVSLCNARYEVLETVEVTANEQNCKAGLFAPEGGGA